MLFFLEEHLSLDTIGPRFTANRELNEIMDASDITSEYGIQSRAGGFQITRCYEQWSQMKDLEGRVAAAKTCSRQTSGETSESNYNRQLTDL
jgi:hypothetical protein